MAKAVRPVCENDEDGGYTTSNGQNTKRSPKQARWQGPRCCTHNAFTSRVPQMALPEQSVQVPPTSRRTWAR